MGRTAKQHQVYSGDASAVAVGVRERSVAILRFGCLRIECDQLSIRVVLGVRLGVGQSSRHTGVGVTIAAYAFSYRTKKCTHGGRFP